MKILFIRSNKAFLPEISAYINYFNKTKEFQAYDTSELSEGYDIRDFDIIWEFKGIGGCNAKDKIMVHEYASLSTGNFPKAKNILKKYINLRPNLRLFLNNYVRKGYNFQDGVDFCYRDMGISEIFFGQMDDAKEYEFVYIGSVSKSREIDKLLKAFTKKENRKICLIGNVEDDIYKQYKKNKNITFTVIQSILISSIRFQLSTYQTSNLNFSSQLIAFLPFTWAHPVKPGFTSCLLACSGEYRSRYLTSKGLGPTKLISPFNILYNSGSSSILVLRKNLPNLVSLSVSGNKFPSASFLSIMLRNLNIVNTLPCKPGRFCRKKIGEPNLILTNKHTINNIGDSITIKKSEKKISKNLLITYFMMFHLKFH
jgi:glycosyltransferase involved in cell wall biosynthesis